jgi:hypothetical protein
MTEEHGENNPLRGQAQPGLIMGYVTAPAITDMFGAVIRS